MSKSYGNAIFLSDPPKEVRNKVGQMITDPQRARRTDPGNPDVCNVFSFHQMYSDQETTQRANDECRKAEIGCVECKKMMAEFLITVLEPIHEKRAYYEANPDTLRAVIEDGDLRAGAVARETMAEVCLFCHKDDVLNPKFEYRSTKQIRMTKIQMTETLHKPFRTLDNSDFGHCFGFRISIFVFQGPHGLVGNQLIHE